MSQEKERRIKKVKKDMEGIVKCPKCGEWQIAEQVSSHRCFSPRLFFGPEINDDGTIGYLASEDGKNWIKKRLSTDYLQHRRSTEDLPE